MSFQKAALLAGLVALSASPSHVAPFTNQPLRLGVRKTAKAGLSGKKRPKKFKGSKAAKKQSRRSLP